MRIRILIFIYTIHFTYLKVYTKFENTGAKKSVTEIFIGEKETLIKKGTDKHNVAFFVTQYDSSLSSFVPNFWILSKVVAEKSLTEKNVHMWVIVKIRQNSCPFHILWKPLMCSWFFFFTQYYWSYLIRLADKTEKYWCVNIFFIGLKPHFLAFLPLPWKKLNFDKNY